MIIVFVLGYLAIALEHPIKIDKAASALLIGGITWALLALGINDIVQDSLSSISHPLKEAYEHFIHSLGSLPQPHDIKNSFKFLNYELAHHLADIGEILFFLLAAMTIVELIDAHQGFSIVTDKIKTTKKVKLMWILCAITFVFSAVLDNLTTSIVMAALLPKLIKGKRDIWMFASIWNDGYITLFVN